MNYQLDMFETSEIIIFKKANFGHSNGNFPEGQLLIEWADNLATLPHLTVSLARNVIGSVAREWQVTFT